jgi:hypothetical protein
VRVTRAGKAVRRLGVGHRLQHGGILPLKLRASNASFDTQLPKPKIGLAKTAELMLNEQR